MNIARDRFRRSTLLATLLVLLLALASFSLTACGGSSDPTSQARSLSPQEAALLRKQRVIQMKELIACARRHGIHLPPPTEGVLNVSGIRGRRREEAISACYQQVLKRTRNEASAEGAIQAEREPGAALGEEPSG